jgi:hypothetical protein
LVKAEGARLIVSGDLTCKAKADQFKRAVDYLGTSYRPQLPSAVPMGLRVNDGTNRWSDRAIPGNHDHWAGNAFIFGGPTKEFFTYFNHVPINSAPLTLTLRDGTNVQLRFLGIDTDIDVRPYGSQRLRARGSFRTHLDHLKPSLGGHSRDEVRVLLLHHSPAHRIGCLGIDDRSHTELERLLSHYDIPVVLTGHIHECLLDHLPRTGRKYYHEVRCGTTSKRTKSTPLMRAGHPAARKLIDEYLKKNPTVNTLVVHRLWEKDDTSIWWEPMAYRLGIDMKSRRGGHGFLPFDIPRPVGLPGEFQVWPR